MTVVKTKRRIDRPFSRERERPAPPAPGDSPPVERRRVSERDRGQATGGARVTLASTRASGPACGGAEAATVPAWPGLRGHTGRRSGERRVGKEGRSRWSA